MNKKNKQKINAVHWKREMLILFINASEMQFLLNALILQGYLAVFAFLLELFVTHFFTINFK